MPLPDPADHSPDCAAVENGQIPDLLFTMSPSEGRQVITLHVWERCSICFAVTAYEKEMLTLSRFHSRWRSRIGIWIATWEHRHNVGGPLQRES